MSEVKKGVEDGRVKVFLQSRRFRKKEEIQRG